MRSSALVGVVLAFTLVSTVTSSSAFEGEGERFLIRSEVPAAAQVTAPAPVEPKVSPKPATPPVKPAPKKSTPSVVRPAASTEKKTAEEPATVVIQPVSTGTSLSAAPETKPVVINMPDVKFPALNGGDTVYYQVPFAAQPVVILLLGLIVIALVSIAVIVFRHRSS